MGSHQNHSCITQILNSGNSMNTHANGMCNTSLQSSRDGSLKLSSFACFINYPQKDFSGFPYFFAIFWS